MKIELTLDAGYVPSWGSWAGVREIIQNAKDAQTLGHPMKVEYKNGKLVVENEEVILDHKAMLIGYTTKADRFDLIGQYGEGFNLGILALVRSGYDVKIRSGSEVWVPSIAPSKAFEGTEVLVFTIYTNRKPSNRVRVEVQGLHEDDWKRYQNRFLFLTEEEVDAIDTSSGTLLLGKGREGHVFVKGIWVHYDEHLAAGYDLHNAKVDRDRRLIDRFDLSWGMRTIWSEAVAKHPDLLLKRFVAMLEDSAEDIKELQWGAGSIAAETATKVAEEFQLAHGIDAVPVKSTADGKDLEHLGKKGVVVTSAHHEVLKMTLGTTEKVKEQLAEEVLETYSWSMLTKTEQDNLTLAMELVGEVTTMPDVDVVRFRSENLLGQYKDGRVLLANWVLMDRAQTLRVLIHEVAHQDGGDGDKGHVMSLEDIWMEIIKPLL